MRSLRPLLLIPLAACAAPEHAEAPDFSWAWRAEIGQPITLAPEQSGDLVWSVIDAPDGSDLWSVPTIEGDTFTFTPDTAGNVTLSVERCEHARCVWGLVSVQVAAEAASSQRLAHGGLPSFNGVNLSSFGKDRPPLAAATLSVSGRVVTLDGTASIDPDGDPLSYEWALVSTPTGVTVTDVYISGARDALATLQVPKRGTYEFQLKVSAKRRFSSVNLSHLIIRIDDDHEPFPD